MTTFSKRSVAGLLCILASALAACGGSGGGGIDNNQSQVVPPDEENIGYLNLGISDAPIRDAAKVCLVFDGVELKHADSDDRETINFTEPHVVNLLAHQGTDAYPLLSGAELPAGEYEWIRLKVQAERDLSGGSNDSDPTSEVCDEETENSYLVRRSGGTFNLYIPSGSQRGLQLINNIVIPVNRTAEYTAEWDLGKSFNGPPGQLPDVMMKPVVKLVANNEVGTLVGQVADELIALDSCDADFAPSVYVFDDGVEPNPFDDPFANDDAIATGLVEQEMLDDGSMPYRYSIGFLLAGDYEAAYTCNGEDFIPLAGKPAPIFVDEVTTVDFLAEDAPGTLAGTVDSAFFNANAPESGFCADDFPPSVYVFDASIEPNFTDAPVAIGDVATDSELPGYSIPLQAGNYTAAFTCSGTDFIPASGKAADILPAMTTTVDFLTGDAPPFGSLSGTVETALVESEDCGVDFAPAVYVFGQDVVPNGTDETVAEGLVELDGEIYRYLVPDLVAGTYTAAYTCTGTDFVPVAGKEAVIVSGEDTPVDFEVEVIPQ